MIDHDPFAPKKGEDYQSDARADLESALGEVESEPKAKRKVRNFHVQTREFFTRRGFHYQRVESYNQHSGKKSDLWGFGDALTFSPALRGSVIVQVTGRSGIGAHIRAAVTNDSGDRYNANRGVVLVNWLLAGNRFWVIGWEKPGRLWVPTIIDVNLKVVEQVQKGERLVIAGLPRVELA